MAASADQAPDSPDWLRAAAGRADRLTRAQLAVLACLPQGMDIKATARALDRSERTIKMHTTAIMVKFGVDSRLKAGIIAHHLLLIGELEVTRPDIPKRPSPNVRLLPSEL